ncbi:MAG: ribonuclease J [Candidatus Peribacteria bacterium]|nr:ribonuclease J [Candidatus Peribacteria bacterium]
MNMTVVEFKNDLIIIDAGLEFASYDMHGVDYIIPDITYLINKKKNIRGIFITHGHLDHIGAIKDIIGKLEYPTVHTTPLALGLIRKSLNDQDQRNFRYKLVDPDLDIVKAGVFTVEFFRVNHSIPESMGLAIHTPKGVIVHSGDFKIDFMPAIDRPADLGKISRIGQEGVKIYLGESTNARTPGHTPSEKIIGENIAMVINRHAKQRIVVSAFASNIGRIIQIIESAVRQNRVVFLAGRSMVNNVQLCQELGYINVPKDMIRQMSSDIEQLPEERVMILCTGSQGEEFSALVRMATNSFKDFTLRPGDCVILSSHTIPGNEKAVASLMNNLVDLGVDLIDDPSLDLHTSGHAYQEDMKEMMALLKPEYFSPVHGESTMRTAHKKIALDMKIPEEKILLPKNGQPIELYDEAVLVADKKLKLDTVMIDGKGQGHLSGEYVIKARTIMAQDGVVTLIFKVDTKTHELVGNLQIESRGFVYSSEVKNIHTKIVDFARATYNANLKKRMDVKDNLRNVKDALGDHITNIIGRVPMLMLTWVYINREAITNATEISNEDAIVGMTLEEQGYED